MNRTSVSNLAVAAALVAFGVVGRLYQPDWNFTPVAAVGMFAAFFFSSRIVAVFVPLLSLTISNLWLESYGHPGILVAVVAALSVPLVWGRQLRSGSAPMLSGVAGGCLASSLLFYLTTNFAHWLLLDYYPHTLAGLGWCYFRALEFLSGTICGDLFFACVLFGSYAFAAAWQRRLVPNTT